MISKHRQNYKDVSNQTINDLTFLEDDGTRTKHGLVMWKIRCYCGNIFYSRLGRIVSGTTKSCGCYRKEFGRLQRTGRTGVNSTRYNHKLTQEERDSRNKYQRNLVWSKSIFERDDYICQICGRRGGKLNAHHLDGWHWCKEKRLDLDNGVTLCKNCHTKFHSVYGNKNNTKEQFEIFRKEQ